MKKLTRESIRKLIEEEIKTLLADDALFKQRDLPGIVPPDGTLDSHKGSSYMAKKQLAKISQYAAELYDMINDNEQIEDWKESHIAQIADDIEEVYGSMRFKNS